VDDPVKRTGEDSDSGAPAEQRPLFLHPQWSVGVVLVFAVMAIVAGLSNPIWWLVGSPFILTLGVYIFVRMFAPARGEADDGDV